MTLEMMQEDSWYMVGWGLYGTLDNLAEAAIVRVGQRLLFISEYEASEDFVVVATVEQSLCVILPYSYLIPGRILRLVDV